MKATMGDVSATARGLGLIDSGLVPLVRGQAGPIVRANHLLGGVERGLETPR